VHALLDKARRAADDDDARRVRAVRRVAEVRRGGEEARRTAGEVLIDANDGAGQRAAGTDEIGEHVPAVAVARAKESGAAGERRRRRGGGECL
jgi:hypothetical protein